MSNIGSGSGSSYPTSLDTQSPVEVDSPNVNKTVARAAVVNDLAAAVIAVETALGTSPQGTAADVKTFLQKEHNTDGTHQNLFLKRTASDFSTFTNKATPVGADVVLIEDSAASGAKKYITLSAWANLINVQYLTTGTGATYTPTAGTKTILVELIGGGGGGGGVSGSASNAAAGAGGNGGGYLMKLITGVSGTGTYTVGGNGAGGANTGGTGGDGANTTFTYAATTYTAGGGKGGPGMTFGTSVVFSSPTATMVASSNGDIQYDGGASGTAGCRLSGTVAASGNGGSSPFGAGGVGLTAQGTGVAATGYGGGGGGALSTGTAYVGGAGTGGLIIVREFA